MMHRRQAKWARSRIPSTTIPLVSFQSCFEPPQPNFLASPTISRTFSTNIGSALNLKESTHGV